jgi:hypothetical protein
MMAPEPSLQLQQMQRVQINVEGAPDSKRLKISIENYDQGLGWYSAGALTVPIHQRPLIEQALEAWRDKSASDAADGNTIVPFPGLRL